LIQERRLLVYKIQNETSLLFPFRSVKIPDTAKANYMEK